MLIAYLCAKTAHAIQAIGCRQRELVLRTWQSYPHIFTNGSSSSIQKKTVLGAFHPYNKEARREFNIFINGQALPFCAELYL